MSSEKSVSRARSQSAQGGFSYTPDQYERSHEKAPVASEGSIDNRKTVKSGATLGRHVTSDSGFQIAQPRKAAVVSNRKSTEKQFDDRRKGTSSV